MKTGTGLMMAAVVVALAGGLGFYAGHRGVAGSAPATGAASPAGQAGAEPAQAEKKLLYYRNPMGLADTSPTPKKDQMGMDYIAVYAGGENSEPAGPNEVRINTQKIQKMGVRTEAAQLRVLNKTVRALGRVVPDERRIYTIAPKFEGYVERLLVNVTGQAVAMNQPLFEVYSPELVSAQREYAIAAQGVAALKDGSEQAQAGMRQLAQSSLLRLKNWDISEAQVKSLAQSGSAQRTLTFRSPVAGIVMDKKAVQGMRFMPGEAMYQVADLSRVWVIADVFEQDLGLVKTGARTSVRLDAYPDKSFSGTVSYVYPTVTAETRTVPVRVELANPGLLIKPGMFAQIELQAGNPAPVLTVPVSAVMDSGSRQIVLVQLGEGRFESREVRLGQRSDNYVAVLDGLKDGEAVVVTANFLIDAESNLKAAMTGFAIPQAMPASAASSALMPGQGAGHHAEGTVDAVDAKDGTVTLSHGPVASLKWPAMTMEFTAANSALLASLKPGARVAFEFVERQPGEWVITSVKPLPGAATTQPQTVR